MPVLGHFGYPPFGWEALLWQCALVAPGASDDGVEVLPWEMGGPARGPGLVQKARA